MAQTIGGIAYLSPHDTYSGYHYEDEVAVVPLLGKDPVRPDKNEVLMTTGKRAQVATIDVLAESPAERDSFTALWATQTTHDDGSTDGSRNVTVTKAEARVLVYSSATPIWLVSLTLRTR